MAPRKLSDSDKNSIVDLYRQPGETTSTLAEQFGVSSSTISRILKSAIPKDEYSQLIAEKRTAGNADSPAKSRRKKSSAKKAKADKPAAKTKAKSTAKSAAKADKTEKDTSDTKPKKAKSDTADSRKANANAEPGKRRRRRRSSKAVEENGQLPLLDSEAAEAQADKDKESSEDKKTVKTESRRPVPKPKLTTAAADSEDDDDDDDDLLGLDETLGDDFGDDDLDEDLEDDDDDDADNEVRKPKLRTEEGLEIMPLGRAVLPKPCYLVVDMRAELITRPLSEFADLGQIPSAEEQSKTLPVFDNHRVARRFSRNKQRVIKVPDGSVITRTSPYLTAKGITRLLVDGQVYDLVEAD